MHDLITEGTIRQVRRDYQETKRCMPVTIHLAAGYVDQGEVAPDRRMMAPTTGQLLLCWCGEFFVTVGTWLQKRSGAIAAS
jgi:hypothetical protein